MNPEGEDLETLDALLAVDCLRAGTLAWLRGHEPDLETALRLSGGRAKWRRRQRRRFIQIIASELTHASTTTQARIVASLLAGSAGSRGIAASLSPEASIALDAARLLKLEASSRTVFRDLTE